MTFAPAGNCTAHYSLPCAMTDWAGNVTSFTYDGMGRLLTVTQPAPYSGGHSR